MDGSEECQEHRVRLGMRESQANDERLSGINPPPRPPSPRRHHRALAQGAGLQDELRQDDLPEMYASRSPLTVQREGPTDMRIPGYARLPPRATNCTFPLQSSCEKKSLTCCRSQEEVWYGFCRLFGLSFLY